jgi:hypothetical protein
MFKREVIDLVTLDPCMECGKLCDWTKGPTYGVCSSCWNELMDDANAPPFKSAFTPEPPDPELLDLLKND